MINSIPMSSICLGRSFTLTSSNNNLWASMSISEISNTGSIVYFKPLSSFQACKYQGSLYYVETKISVSPYSVHFRQKALKVILLYNLQILYGVFICNKITSQHILSFIIFFLLCISTFGKVTCYKNSNNLILHQPLF